MIQLLPTDLKDKELHTVYYSVDEKLFHTGFLSNDLKLNYGSCLEGSSTDFQLIFIGTQEECSRFSEEFEKEVKDAPKKVNHQAHNFQNYRRSKQV